MRQGQLSLIMGSIAIGLMRAYRAPVSRPVFGKTRQYSLLIADSRHQAALNAPRKACHFQDHKRFRRANPCAYAQNPEAGSLPRLAHHSDRQLFQRYIMPALFQGLSRQSFRKACHHHNRKFGCVSHHHGLKMLQKHRGALRWRYRPNQMLLSLSQSSGT